MRHLIPILILTSFFSTPCFAGDMHHDHQSKSIYAPAMDSMHATMGQMQPTGDADIDFVREMIPHHQAAVDMAEIELQRGKDADIKKLAADILVAQKKEIAMMQEWLKQHDKHH